MGGDPRGLTLVEVLVALFLITLGILAAAPMFLYAMQGNAVGADLGELGALAVERMERLRAEPFPNLAAGGDLTSSQTVGGVAYFDASNPGFVLRWEIVDNTTPPSTKIIRLRAISTDQGSGVRRQVDLTTLRGD